MSKYKIIRFSQNKIRKYSEDLSVLMSQGPTTEDSKPYIGIIDKEKDSLISCIWLDSLEEICMITEKSYRNQGLMKRLLGEIVGDVFKGKMDEVSAMPTGIISKSILKRSGFLKEDRDWYSFSIS